MKDEIKKERAEIFDEIKELIKENTDYHGKLDAKSFTTELEIMVFTEY
jgi:hypothetical protein